MRADKGLYDTVLCFLLPKSKSSLSRHQSLSFPSERTLNFKEKAKKHRLHPHIDNGDEFFTATEAGSLNRQGTIPGKNAELSLFIPCADGISWVFFSLKTTAEKAKRYRLVHHGLA